MSNPALNALRHHVTGAIARGEAVAIVEKPALVSCDMLRVCNYRMERFYVNGRRVSRKRWDIIEINARMYGVQECSSTSVKSNGSVYHRHVARVPATAVRA